MRRLSPAAVLLEKAREDMAAAQSAALTGEPFGFFCQQSVEKSYKAVLNARGIAFRRIHDLRELWDLLGDHGVKIDASLAALQRLTLFAVDYRYDVWLPETESLDRPALLDQVRACLTWAEGELARASR